MLHIRSATSKDAPDDFLNEINSKENFELDINAPVSAPSKTKLKVSTRSDYPNNFPQTLISLQMTGIRLKDIDLRWFRLKALRHLDLSENRLGTIRTPAQWQKFYMIESLENLEELILHRNAFSGFPVGFIEYFKFL